MRLISFKEKYEIKIKISDADRYIYTETLIIDPIERIQQGFKTTTTRLNKIPLGPYRIRQGSRFKPKIVRDFYLRFYKREARTFLAFSQAEIQRDLGLKHHELKIILENIKQSLRGFFVKEIGGIDRKSGLKLMDLCYFYHFKVISRNHNKKIDEFFTPETFCPNLGKCGGCWAAPGCKYKKKSGDDEK